MKELSSEEVKRMPNDVSEVSYIFWKLNILFSTLNRLHEVMMAKTKSEREVNSEDLRYLENAENILKSVKVSLEDLKIRIDKLKEPPIKNYLNNLYDKVELKLREIMNMMRS